MRVPRQDPGPSLPQLIAVAAEPLPAFDDPAFGEMFDGFGGHRLVLLDESFLDAAQNARLIVAAEQYYRAMYYGGPDSWNLRDTHIFETLDNPLDAQGPNSKAIVWAHNSHVGDARHTERGAGRGERNVGQQLCRERYRKKLF